MDYEIKGEKAPDPLDMIEAFENAAQFRQMSDYYDAKTEECIKKLNAICAWKK